MTKRLYRKETKNLTPVRPVDIDKVSAAVKLLQDQELAVYQRLYVVGLTGPGAATAHPFSVRRSVAHLACVEVFPAGHEQYRFLVRTPEEVELVREKAELLYDAINTERPLIHSHACCPLAEFRPCVCDVSFQCPIHGARCYGTHN